MPLPLLRQSSKPETKKFQSGKIVPCDNDLSNKKGENHQAKISPFSPQGMVKKRSAFEDLTNASQSQPAQSKKEANKEIVKDVFKNISKNRCVYGSAKHKEMKMKRYKLEISPVTASTTSVPNIMEKTLIVDISSNFKTPATEEASLINKSLVLKEETTTEETNINKMSMKKCRNHEEMPLLKQSLSLQEQTDSDDEFVIETVTLGKKHKVEETAISEKTLSLKKKTCTHQGKKSYWEELWTSQDNNDDDKVFDMEPVSFRKKPKTEKSSPTKKQLTLKKQQHATKGRISNVMKPVVLQKVTSEEKSLSKEPLSFKRKSASEKVSVFWKSSTLQEKPATEREVSISKTSLTLWEKIDLEEESFFKESSTFKEKPTTEETFSNRKCITQGKISYSKKPLVLQKVTSGEKSLITKPSPFRKMPTTEQESLSWESSTLQEKHTTQEVVGFLKKPRALQENRNHEDKSFMELVSYKKKHIIKQTTYTKKPSPLNKKFNTQGVISCLKPQTVTLGRKSLTKEPLTPQKSPTKEESLLEEAVGFPKEHTIEKATLSKNPLSLKKQQPTTQGTVSHMKKPLVLQMVTSEEKSLVKELLSFKEENVSLEKKKGTTYSVPFWKELSDWQDIIDKESNSFYVKPVSLRKKPTTEETVLSKIPLSLKKKETTHGKVFLVKNPLVLQKTTSEKSSLYKKLLPLKKKPTTEEKFSKEPSSLKKKHTTQQEVSLLKQPSFFQEITTEEKSDSKDPATLKEKLITEKKFLFQEPHSLHFKPTNEDESLFQKALVLQEKTSTKEDSPEKLLALQEKSISEEKSLFNKLSNLEKEPSTEEVPSIEGQLSLMKLDAQGQLVLHENITSDEKFIINQPMILQEFLNIEKEILLEEPLVIQENPSIEKETVLKKPLILPRNSTIKKQNTMDTGAHFKEALAFHEKPSIEEQQKPTVGGGGLFMEPLALQENPSAEMEATLKELWALQEKLNIQKVTIPEETLVIQEKSNVEKEPLAMQEKTTTKEIFLFKEILDWDEKPITGKEFSFKDPLALEENPTHKEDTFSKTFLTLDIKNDPCVSSTTLESSTDKSSAANMCNAQYSTTSQSSECEPDSKGPFSSQSESIEKEMTIPEDIDKDHSDPCFNSIYAKDIFSYLKKREENFILIKYMDKQTDINSDMRAILVDWLVEVQMTFEICHETLYLAVKLVDHYLMKVVCQKDKLQLLGSTAFLTAAKFEEPSPPCVDDFLYICDDIYKRDELHAMEISILQALNFDINIPIAYHFLRRYARCVHASMKTLTLSRFICEMTLQEYDYVQERASKLAAGSFLLALYMKKLEHCIPILEYYSGYESSELHPLVRRLNFMLTFSSYNRLKTVYSKYSHQIFFEVAKIPPLDTSKLEEILGS
ncbi:G2/mitotic-specific cyclin-B3-like [Marmota flaviventris]|uniref:G2/mitotic-specific cyclin-B3-like n=1 Tax=Marmota flaviventris TaxID=93162 RepID=UPI003A897744